jgi:hypothetical protein
MTDRVLQARRMLNEQRDRLRAVIREDAFMSTTLRARELLKRVRRWLREPVGAIDLALGAMGPNGFGPAIDDTCRSAAWHQANPGARDMSLRAVNARAAERRAAERLAA